ncbi:MAG: hypothetical protein PHS88_03385 [Candidatus Omnitrophica bacterium]|nr:hypothetical protein [Candidatus Omnitrophota bacterium]
MSPAQRLAYEASDVNGFVIVRAPDPSRNSNYAIVTNFKGGIVKTQTLPGMKSPEDVKNWIDKNLETADFEGVEVKHLTLPVVGKAGEAKALYWVGQKSYISADEAQSQIALVKSVAEYQGGNFEEMVSQAKRYIPEPEKPPPVEIKSRAQFEKEEDIALRWADQFDIGEKLYGPFQGVPAGEPVLWQSFGETSFRTTNLEKKSYSNQVAFWTNRVVFKGIRAPINTIDPYIELTPTIETAGPDYKSYMLLFGGLEWRPFQRNAWLYNYRPYGGIPLLLWVQNYRLYVQYGNRFNLKGEIPGSANHDLIWGVSIFYEFGTDLPTVAEEESVVFSDYLRKYVWGEYFGNYRVEMTNFSALENKYNGVILNSSITLGLKMPGIPLPENPINNELVLMPYLRFEHVNSADFSFFYQNRYFVAAGMRWMPFRNFRYKENEWLSKVKIFGEYVGVGETQFAKQDGKIPPGSVRADLRFGVNISSRRF